MQERLKDDRAELSLEFSLLLADCESIEAELRNAGVFEVAADNVNSS